MESRAAAEAQDRMMDAAIERADRDALLLLLAEDFKYTHARGKLQTKHEYIDDICSREVRPARLLSAVTMERHREVAVTRGNLDCRYSDGRPVKRFRYLRIWRQQDANEWQAMSHHTFYASDHGEP
jgi:hypothetical protein